jgi:AcrR family transcriptional regulator
LLATVNDDTMALTVRGAENDMQSRAERNKALRKTRNMRYFIDATREIIAEGGLEAVNIRNVAARAGYSSGSIYEYFKSIDQLTAFAAIDSINDFIGDIDAHMVNRTDPLELYLLTWHFFSLHALQKPALYEKVVLLYGPNIVAFLNEYYEIFPHELEEFPKELKKSFFAEDRGDRDKNLLLQCVEKGYFRREDIDAISKMVNAGFLGCIKYRASASEEFDHLLFDKMIRAIMLGFNPKLAPVLEGIARP